MTRRARTLPLWALLGTIALAAQSGAAAPLEDILTSEVMKTFETQTEDAVYKKNIDKELPPNSNLRRIFVKKSGALQLNVWLAPNERTFLPGKQKSYRVNEYVMAERIFTRADGMVLNLQTYVAHPHYVRIADLGLLKAWAELKPPKLATTFSMPVTIQGIPTTAYKTAAGGVAVSIPVMSGAIVHLTTPKWTDLGTALEFAEKLDIARLRTKLTT